ncbi:uncharacterized protein J8A68_001721 [[Candida] subhashii]|uniref:Letm1 RBD domain-containing protein n=1 Tax=[Candida] subhashii TaxID=561895 RepID=A0A8J5QQC0_9ASCO|nr:uncharacterized protein J8A68_001721 [[Candida] subhashii]KAG7664766.1 hypothetical protein J8A68_001721 [[Candida] subhashii]
MVVPSGVKYGVFYTFPSNKQKLLSQINQSQLLTSLWKTNTNNSESSNINSPTTIPIPIRPKKQVYEQVTQENPTKGKLILKSKQLYHYAKELLKFYRIGINNVWTNLKTMRQLKKHKYKISNQLDAKGKSVAIRLPNFPKLTEIMAQSMYMSKVEHKVSQDKISKQQQDSSTYVKRQSSSPSAPTAPNSKSTSQATLIDPNLFSLSRQEYQILKRSPKDSLKLPLFAVTFLIFEELTPLLCLLIPELSPRTCILPQLLPKIYPPTPREHLHKSAESLNDERKIDLALKTAYNLDYARLKLLSQSLRLTSRYVPISLYPENMLRVRLQQYLNYLRVDNYYLSGLSGEDNLWNLDEQELIIACLERNLIEDISEYVKLKQEGLDSVELDEYCNRLRLRLLQFLIDFPKYNIGMLCIDNPIPLDHQQIITWREN